MSYVGPNTLKHFVQKYFGNPKNITGLGDGTVTGAIKALLTRVTGAESSIKTLNDSLDDISRSGDNWINTETTAAHAYAVGLEYADPSERNKDNPIPVLKYDHENDFPLMRIEGVSSSIRPYSMELIRGSSGWSLRIHSFIDGGIHALDVPLNLIS